MVKSGVNTRRGNSKMKQNKVEQRREKEKYPPNTGTSERSPVDG